MIFLINMYVIIFSNALSVSSISSQTSVKVIPNPVLITNIKHDGPKMYNESITWTVEIENYGYNPCFIWWFSNISFTVLMGGQHCRSIILNR
jgi:hypothetical protein